MLFVFLTESRTRDRRVAATVQPVNKAIDIKNINLTVAVDIRLFLAIRRRTATVEVFYKEINVKHIDLLVAVKITA